MDIRQSHLKDWLAKSFKVFAIKFLAHDAGTRRYFRLFADDQTYVVMDAPPECEDVYAFVAVAQAFNHAGLHVPKIYACDLKQGFLLLSDFGDDRFDRILTPENADLFYEKALEVLPVIQRLEGIPGVHASVLDREFMLEELANFRHWYLEVHLGLRLSTSQEATLERFFTTLVEAISNQTYVYMHRDFHSRNLMWHDERVGVLDFQSTMIGPLTYDAVSLLKDCYQAWPRERIEAWALRFRETLHHYVPAHEFLRDFDFMGVQRHLKAVMTFSRKYHRDHDEGYLCYISNTLRYVMDVVKRYPELMGLNMLFEEILPEWAVA